MQFTEEIKKRVWAKGKVVLGFDSDKFRKDECGAWMTYNLYSNRQSIYGWEIDYIDPNGPANVDNFKPLQWENILSKSDGILKCKVTSDNNINVYIP
ncbi:MAG: HNH endonuclease [Ignavibacteria bacterium]|nr:HNH endonuclease [Ignavibacteria bacterium]